MKALLDDAEAADSPVRQLAPFQDVVGAIRSHAEVDPDPTDLAELRNGFLDTIHRIRAGRAELEASMRQWQAALAALDPVPVGLDTIDLDFLHAVLDAVSGV